MQPHAEPPLQTSRSSSAPPPTAENIIGEHRECAGASGLRSQRESAPNGPMGTRRAIEPDRSCC
jgi:hypothetical protein